MVMMCTDGGWCFVGLVHCISKCGVRVLQGMPHSNHVQIDGWLRNNSVCLIWPVCDYRTCIVPIDAS